MSSLKFRNKKLKPEKSKRREERRKRGREVISNRMHYKKEPMWHMKVKVSQKHGSENVNHLVNMP